MPRDPVITPAAPQLRRIVERAIAPWEWASYADASFAADAPDAQALLERWETLVLRKSPWPNAFDARLAKLGLDRKSALDYLRPRTLPDAAPLPAWAKMLEEILAAADVSPARIALEHLQAWTELELDSYQLDLARFPLFPEALGAFVSYALQSIERRAPQLRLIGSAEIPAQLARRLVFRLSTLACRAMAYEVKQRRNQGRLIGDTPQARYRYFAGEVLATRAGLTEWFLQYPVLARLLTVCTAHMIDATVELLERLERDRAELESLFCPGKPPGRLENILTGLSDAHNGGRTVCILGFESGLRLVYKPRSCAVDHAFSSFVRWMNERGTRHALKALRVLPKSGYGWTEFIATEECASGEQIARFYYRHGVNAAMMYFLCGMDFHYENFIAAGEYPVPVDLECVLMTALHSLPQAGDLPRYLQPVGLCSLLSSNVASYWRAGDYSQVLFSATGINGCGGRPWPMLTHAFQNLGTDALKLARDYREFLFDDNLPRLHGAKIPVNNYIASVVDGFTSAYRLFLEHRADLLRADGPLAEFRTVTTRVVLRDTSEYARSLFWAVTPDHLTSGAAHDVALELLNGVVTGDSDIRVEDLLDEEKRCCWQQDIPVYVGCPAHAFVRSGEGTEYGPLIPTPSYDQMQERLRQAGEEDLQWQAEILRVALDMAADPDGELRVQPRPQPGPLDPVVSLGTTIDWAAFGGWSSFDWTQSEPEPPAAHELQSGSADEENARLRTAAIGIGDALARLALRHGAGLSWIGHVKSPGDAAVVALINPFPWHSMGAAATSLFFSNLACLTLSERDAGIAAGALRFTDAMLEYSVRSGLWPKIPVSGYNGVGLAIYAMTEHGRLLQQEGWLDKAQEWAGRLTPGQLAEQSNPDMLGGAASALLALLHLQELRPTSELLERAHALAGSILRCQDAAGGWVVPGFERPLLGMGHGAAGIAYSLAMMHAVTGAGEYRDGALRGLEFERSKFDTALKEWPDLRESADAKNIMTGWCAGAPGIGLARLGVMGVAGDCDGIGAELDFALASTLSHLGRFQDHLCCGDAGRIIFLTAAGQCLERADLRDAARRGALRMAAAHERSGCWRLQEFTERSIAPGLLDGVAGVGLAFLSVLAPATTSRVLQLQ